MSSSGIGAGLGTGVWPADAAQDVFGVPNAATEATSSPNERRKVEIASIVGPIVVLVLFVAAWHWMHTNGMRLLFDKPGFLLPAPETVINDSFFNSIARGRLLNGLGWTTLVALGGLAITIVLGIGIAVAMAQAAWVERAGYPYLVALQAIPILAIVPVIGVVLGFGLNARFFVCVLISIFPIVTNTLFGLMSADVGQHDLFTLRRVGRLTRLWRLQLPAAMPAIFTGFRISAGLSVIGAVVGEQFFRQGSKPGVGIVMETYRQKGIYPQMYGGLLIAAALGIAVFLVFGLIGRLVVGHWHDSTRKSG